MFIEDDIFVYFRQKGFLENIVSRLETQEKEVIR